MARHPPLMLNTAKSIKGLHIILIMYLATTVMFTFPKRSQEKGSIENMQAFSTLKLLFANFAKTLRQNQIYVLKIASIKND